MKVATLRRKLVRKASRAVVGGMRPPESPLASWFGTVRVAETGEAWPQSSGRPMVPLCQLNLHEAPYVPVRLQDVALLTVFLDAEALPLSTPNGSGWLLRTYGSLEGLAPVKPPDGMDSFVRPFAIRWELISEDYPCREDIADPRVLDDLDEEYDEVCENQSCTKLGGWPTLIQSEIYWAPFNRHPANPEYVFQIGTEPKAHFAWGDSGVGYFGRGTGEHSDVWTMEWQCY